MNWNSTFVTILLWIAQLLVAVFFISGYVSFYMRMWSRGFRDPERSKANRSAYRIFIILMTLVCATILNAVGYISGTSAVFYHNVGLFIVILALLDEDTNIGEYLLRYLMLVAIWMVYYVGHFSQIRFLISMAILVVVLILVRLFRVAIGPHFKYRLLIATTLAADFWFNLPAHPADMNTTQLSVVGAVVMFFLMKLSTGEQQRQFFENLKTAHLANYDELTSTKNFMAYQKDIINYFGSAHVNRQPLTVAQIDVDHFKLINDQYGHLAGNQILTDVAQTLRKIISQYGERYEVYRTGGEEFTLIFADTSIKEALQVMIHCWQEIRTQTFTYGQQAIHVTISVGMTGMRTDNQSPEGIYKRADDSLYISKKNGRDTITINGKTQQLKDDSNHVTYAYFVRGIYDLKQDSGQELAANELTLRRFDRKSQTWVVPEQRHLNIETRIDLTRDALVNSHTRTLVTTLSIADFLNEDVGTKLAAYFHSPDGPDSLYLELDQLPAMNLLIPRVEFYHQQGIKIVLGQVDRSRHFERVNASLRYLDGVKCRITSTSDLSDLQKNIQFWGRVAQTWRIRFIIDGVNDKEQLKWLLAQKYINYLEGDYFGEPKLPLLNS